MDNLREVFDELRKLKRDFQLRQLHETGDVDTSKAFSDAFNQYAGIEFVFEIDKPEVTEPGVESIHTWQGWREFVCIAILNKAKKIWQNNLVDSKQQALEDGYQMFYGGKPYYSQVENL